MKEIEDELNHNTKIEITLKNEAMSSILSTFEENVSKLKSIYEIKAKIPNRFINGNGMDYLTILCRIVTMEQQHQMYQKLIQEFTEDGEKYSNNRTVSLQKIIANFSYFNSKLSHDERLLFQHENLFWTILLPEWVVSICMKKFDLDKSEVLAKIKHDDENSLNDSFEL